MNFFKNAVFFFSWYSGNPFSKNVFRRFLNLGYRKYQKRFWGFQKTVQMFLGFSKKMKNFWGLDDKKRQKTGVFLKKHKTFFKKTYNNINKF